MAVRPIRSGELRHVITLQSRQITRTAQGGFLPLSWVNSVTGIRARISPKAGNEAMFSDAVRAQATHFITIRAQTADITPDQRIVFGSLAFNIIQALPVDYIKHEILIAAEQLVSATASVSGNNAVPSYEGFFETAELDFLATQDITYNAPSGKYFYIDSVEIVCTQFAGALGVQPTFRAGPGGTLTKYVSRLTTQLTGVRTRQVVTSMASQIVGETNLHLGVSVVGSGPTTYRGTIAAYGKLKG
jgi:head-tail adaptor